MRTRSCAHDHPASKHLSGLELRQAVPRAHAAHLQLAGPPLALEPCAVTWLQSPSCNSCSQCQFNEITLRGPWAALIHSP